MDQHSHSSTDEDHHHRHPQQDESLCPFDSKQTQQHKSKPKHCSVKHPIHLIDRYYSALSLEQQNENLAMPAASVVNDLPNRHRNHDKSNTSSTKKLDDTLRIIDFLLSGQNVIRGKGYDHQPLSTSLVDGTIKLVDKCISNSKLISSTTSEVTTSITDNRRRGKHDNNNDNRCTNMNNKKTNKRSFDSISRMVSPHGRSLYLVSKGSTIKRKINGSDAAQSSSLSSDSASNDSSSYYLCIPSNDGVKSSSAGSSAGVFLNHCHQVPYCSCRSFMERNRVQHMNFAAYSNDTSNANAGHTPVILCKHLLAIHLLPMFCDPLFDSMDQESTPQDKKFHIPTMEFASEEDYSRALIQRIFQ